MSHILVVDDMPMHVDYLKEELENLDYEVSTASDGEECLRQIARKIPDLVLLNYAMPELDGLGVLKILRSEETYANLPVILLTARKDVEDRVEGLDAGADDYITKPFHIGKVIARIRAPAPNPGTPTQDDRPRKASCPDTGSRSDVGDVVAPHQQRNAIDFRHGATGPRCQRRRYRPV